MGLVQAIAHKEGYLLPRTITDISLPLRMQIWTVLAKVTKVFRSNLAKSSDCKLGWQNGSKTASGRLNMKVIGSWKQRSGGRVWQGKVLVVKDFRPDYCPQKGARRCNFLHKWSRNRENMSLATYISFQTSENIEEMFKTNNKRAQNLSKMAKKRGRTVQHQ